MDLPANVRSQRRGQRRREGLTDRTHYVSLSNHCSAFSPVHSGVPQCSVLGPMLLTMYIKPLSAIIDSHSIIHHSFADDLQIQMSVPPACMPLLNRPARSMATLGDRSFSFASSSVWKSIPSDIRCAPSLSSSKSRLKKYLFCSVYKDRTVSLITVHMCMVWPCHSFVDGLS